MREVCFCGWIGEPLDRRIVDTPKGRLAAACPSCGRLDTLEWLSRHDRQELMRRHAGGPVPASDVLAREMSAV